MQNPLVSIIIPTYNRAHLIGETLDSVIAQTYSNWECIVVDDGSTDNTDEVLKMYCEKDSRIQYHHRPVDRLPGGNAARNYGFEMSKGEYINWFDDDDLMLSNFILIKIENLSKRPDLDFVITRGVNFLSDGTYKNISIRNNISKKLDHNNFILFEIFWTTPDFFFRRERIGEVRFDNEIKSGQEYNFFVKLLAINLINGFFLNKILFERRIHSKSIQGNLLDSNNTFVYNQYILYKNTFLAVLPYLNVQAKQHLLMRIASSTFELKRRRLKTPKLYEVFYILKKEKGLTKALIFIFSIKTAYLFGKGFKLMDYSRS